MRSGSGPRLTPCRARTRIRGTLARPEGVRRARTTTRVSQGRWRSICDQDRRSVNTARTRRCKSADASRSSFPKIDVMWASTVRSVTTSRPAIALFDKPSATNPRTSRSRSVSRAIGSSRRRRPSRRATIVGSTTVSPPGSRTDVADPRATSPDPGPQHRASRPSRAPQCRLHCGARPYCGGSEGDRRGGVSSCRANASTAGRMVMRLPYTHRCATVTVRGGRHYPTGIASVADEQSPMGQRATRGGSQICANPGSRPQSPEQRCFC